MSTFGKIYPQYHATCAHCGNDEDTFCGSIASTAIYLKRIGWVYRNNQWVCEECEIERKENKKVRHANKTVLVAIK